jgi:ribonuclease R
MREFPSPSEILRVLEEHPGTTFRLRELVVELGLRSSQARELKHALKDLSRDRKILYLKKNHFVLASQDRHAVRAHGGAALPSRVPHGAQPGRDAAAQNAVPGRLIGHRDGYGFVVPDREVAETDQDIFIPPGGMASALHGDRVEVRVVRSKADGRLEGRILRVLDRAQKTVVGEFHCGAAINYVAPFDHRIPHEIVIPRGQEWPEEIAAARHRQFGGESEGSRVLGPGSAGVSPALVPAHEREGRPRRPRFPARDVRDLDGMIVDVEITHFPGSGAPPTGRVTEVLGRRDDFGVDVEIMIRKFHLPHRFPPAVLAEAEEAPQFIPEPAREGRRDFRSLPIVTIDGESAKDFDDAVYVERLLDGSYQLQVHIADVAHYVRPGMALDREARLRGTSVYFPDRAVPMLPLELSNGICSLNPHVERLTMSALVEIDPAGRAVEYEIVPGIIRSAERMTYTAVNAVLTGDAAACHRYRDLVENFKLLEELARLLNQRREARGSIDFDLPEPEIEFDEFGRMIGIMRSERNIAHRIIEEFMLMANEVVATHLERRDVPSLYRIHEPPDPRKVIEFEEIAASFGYSLGVELPAAHRVRVRRRDDRERYPRFQETVDRADLKITSRHYQRLTQRVAGKPEERILSYLMLRSLQQARYSEENVGHFALASPTYTHFTSPIRRYPDLIVHRILKAVLAQEGGSARGRMEDASATQRGGTPSPRRIKTEPAPRWPSAEPLLPGGAFVDRRELSVLGLETSEAERRAADAERELMEWKKVSFMARRLGDEFDALIISLTKHGLYVELTDLFVEGFVPLDSFTDDRYVYREKLRAIVGQHSKRAYRLGARVKVLLERIDRDGNKLLFSITA